MQRPFCNLRLRVVVTLVILFPLGSLLLQVVLDADAPNNLDLFTNK